jgi:hypothetical protein
MKNIKLIKALIGIFLLLCLTVPSNPANAANGSTLPSFTEFVGQVFNGQPDVIRGVYVAGVLALQVVQQPVNDPGKVIAEQGVATQFRAASENKNIGLLAHNNLAGAVFSKLKVGQEVGIIYGNGRVDYFIVNHLASYQALQPDSQTGDFVDQESNLTYSAGQIFNMFYTGAEHVTFQTCILKDGIASWGRLFVTAIPYFSVDFRGFRALRFDLGWSTVQ